MKRVSILALALCIAFSAGAQTMLDGYTFCQNNYFGTARSVGLGNALTAVGGDLGSVQINPAGSAVAGYSQITLSPGITIGSTSSSFSASEMDGFSNSTKASKSRFNVPNLGVVINFNTKRDKGIKSLSYGLVMNSTNKFNNKIRGMGYNNTTSYLGAAATAANGFASAFLNGEIDESWKPINSQIYPYLHSDDRGQFAPWNVIAAYQAYGIDNFGDDTDPDYPFDYIGATEKYDVLTDEDGNHSYGIYLGGPLNQQYMKTVTGSKDDIVFNFGMNISDIVYVGANLGITTMNYECRESFLEQAVNPADFSATYTDLNGKPYETRFREFRALYAYNMDAAGVYGKFGVIVTPGAGFRIGTAIQTPTMISVDERWKNGAESTFSNVTHGFDDNHSAYSPRGEYNYYIRSPYIWNIGVAKTFGGMALLSIDYEITDYSKMRFKEKNNDSFHDSFSELNKDIDQMMEMSQSLRAGVEIRPLSSLSVRAGFNYSSTPISSYAGNYLQRSYHEMTSVSIGLGLASSGSFFCDLAGRLSMYSNEYISPYANYDDNHESPLIRATRNRWDLVATFGWRF